MSDKKKTKDQKIAALEKRIEHLEACATPYGYRTAQLNVGKCGFDRFTASGVIMRLTAYMGEDVMPPVMIKDGLSPETILAIQRDLYRSCEMSIIDTALSYEGDKS